MLTVQLNSSAEAQLQRLARESGRTVDEYAREALLQHLEDLDDIREATKRLNTPGKTFSLDEAKRELGL
jgi:RHH-type rel operon transcriptional repressor/antitoxin RelB